MSQLNASHIPLSLDEFDRITQLFASVLSTAHAPVVIPGEAILGIEAMAAGIAAPGRKILNIVTGPYGSLFGSWLERGGATVVEVKVSFDKVVTVREVHEAIKRHSPCAISFVQAEVVTGGSNPAKEILEVAKEYQLVTIMDSVSAVGGEQLLTDEWGVDLVAIGAQKALAGPNGISAVGISPRGWQFIETNPHAPRNSILSLLDLKPSTDRSAPRRVPPNLPSLEGRALITALSRIEDEGLEQVIRRHELAAASLHAGAAQLGLTPWQQDSQFYSTLTSTIRIADEPRLHIDQPIGIVAPGDGELFGQLLRVNHFGLNASKEGVSSALITLAELLKHSPEAALTAAAEIWEGRA